MCKFHQGRWDVAKQCPGFLQEMLSGPLPCVQCPPSPVLSQDFPSWQPEALILLRLDCSFCTVGLLSYRYCFFLSNVNVQVPVIKIITYLYLPFEHLDSETFLPLKRVFMLFSLCCLLRGIHFTWRWRWSCQKKILGVPIPIWEKANHDFFSTYSL